MLVVGKKLFENPSGTREEILAATYRALVEHGYADLTITRIGDELEKSQSLIYHHYDGKDDLVLACLEFMLAEFESTMDDSEIEDPRARLEAAVDWMFACEFDDEHQQFFATTLELRARANYDPAYRDHFTRSDRAFDRQLTTIVREGIEQSVFQECDPEAVASTLTTLQTGALFRRVSADGTEWLADVREEIDVYLEQQVYATSE
ncbi:TetR/AcrR family transcriptional regulator [Natronobacterium gregoryi]|uniref:Regulatory protein TetR n=2 Tax=Natronobacterium gregoryi TaxID=44930 RepID=L0ALF3_NATGS|nr:TetR/AcrR family transcriptional regulator [Natronobacterium gregoryi]AFZ73885.1 transcriptional regulator [Natronobacterium gregoryi SP2]ELY64841.1 regulatory protein TetR [Natronobacterium gregoryi SP2]PLK19157.1 TetR/AcrR family transcriptional regulator [Natronobacterium gregoryi SP2]SFJ59458.1 transcriptional regulator, TetR family [Natronobacterium gregoryi]